MGVLKGSPGKEPVPQSAILREDQATYTYENAIYSRKVTDSLGMEIQRAIPLLQTLSCQKKSSLLPAFSTRTPDSWYVR